MENKFDKEKDIYYSKEDTSVLEKKIKNVEFNIEKYILNAYVPLNRYCYCKNKHVNECVNEEQYRKRVKNAKYVLCSILAYTSLMSGMGIVFLA